MSLSPVFSMDLVAAADDVDELGHISNLVYVRWIQDVAHAHSLAVGYDMDAYRELGAVFVVRRHEIDYLRPTYAGERVRLRTWIDSWKAATSWRMTSILRIGPDRGDQDIELARGKTLWALIGTTSGRPTRIPDALKDAFIGPIPGAAPQP